MDTDPSFLLYRVRGQLGFRALVYAGRGPGANTVVKLGYHSRRGMEHFERLFPSTRMASMCSSDLHRSHPVFSLKGRYFRVIENRHHRFGCRDICNDGGWVGYFVGAGRLWGARIFCNSFLRCVIRCSVPQQTFAPFSWKYQATMGSMAWSTTSTVSSLFT